MEYYTSETVFHCSSNKKPNKAWIQIKNKRKQDFKTASSIILKCSKKLDLPNRFEIKIEKKN